MEEKKSNALVQTTAVYSRIHYQRSPRPVGIPQNSDEEPASEDGQHQFMAHISHQGPQQRQL